MKLYEYLREDLQFLRERLEIAEYELHRAKSALSRFESIAEDVQALEEREDDRNAACQDDDVDARIKQEREDADVIAQEAHDRAVREYLKNGA
jgi:deoxyribodipyrimidine photolyase